MRKSLFITAAAVLFVGCSTPIPYNQRAMSISMDMPKSQVVSLMGNPKRVSARKKDNDLIERYSWWSPVVIGFTVIDNEIIAKDRVFVLFKNEQVIEWGDKYDMSDSMDKVTETQKAIMSEVLNRSLKVDVNVTEKSAE